ncbi:MAG: hypothetical protein J2P17_19220 [Mycobacterium sp.]|nr:hypothetical protein [Mycobacterium sp.]
MVVQPHQDTAGSIDTMLLTLIAGASLKNFCAATVAPHDQTVAAHLADMADRRAKAATIARRLVGSTHTRVCLRLLNSK